MKIGRHWLIVGVSFIGFLFSSAPVFNYTFGVFLLPIAETFGWPRGQVSLMFSTYLVVQAMFLPIAGKLIDRFGARAILLPALAGFGVCLCILGLLPAHPLVWYSGFVVVAAFVAGCGAVPYAKVLTAWHNEKRGLALGIAAAGIGVGAAIFPIWSQRLISAAGWQFAYMSLGIIVLVGGFPIIALFLRNTPQDAGLEPDGHIPGTQTNATIAAGAECTSSQAMQTPTFWILAVVAGLGAAAILGTVTHLPALLVDMGIGAKRAALAAGIIGAASLLGRIVVGWSLDRIFAAHIAIACFLSVAGACVLLAIGTSGGGSLVCAALLGFAIGAEFDIVTYATSRYFGHKHFSQIYGYLFAAFILGSSFGPPLMGFGHDMTGSYTAPLSVNVIMILTASGLLLWLPPYPDGNR